MAYLVKEIFYSLQGEGVQSGRPAVFVRFSGCNLWSGNESDRERARCRICDTDFVGTDGIGGGRFEGARDLAVSAASHLPVSTTRTYKYRSLVILTGGEPALQADGALINELHNQNFEVAIETNGTVPVPQDIDWVTVSPKAGNDIIVRAGEELKLLYPQAGVDPSSFEGLDFKHFVLQPVYGPYVQQNTHSALTYCLEHPRWRLGLQLHKMLGIK